MQLKIEVEKLDAVRRRMAVEVPREVVTGELERSFAELARSVSVPGFRKGRVPRPVLERMFNDRVRRQVFEQLVSSSYVEAVRSEGLAVVGYPEFETQSADLKDALRYEALIEVRPEITVVGYEGVEAGRPVQVVGQAEVDSVLERMRQSHARLHPITDRTKVQMGDVVTLSYEARREQVLLGRGEHRDVEVGSNGFPEGFDEQLLLAATGETRLFSITYPEEYTNPELAGKVVNFSVTIEGLSAKELPALDDDFAKTHGECDTLEGLVERIRSGLQQEADRNADEIVRRRLLDKVMESNDIPVPGAMVQQRLESMTEEVLEDWRRQRVAPKNDTRAREELQKDLGPKARDQVKLSLLLEGIFSQENLRVSDEELEARIAAIAEGAGAAAERVTAFYAEKHVREQLRTSLLNSRAVECIVERARIHDEPVDNQIADAGQAR